MEVSREKNKNYTYTYSQCINTIVESYLKILRCKNISTVCYLRAFPIKCTTKKKNFSVCLHPAKTFYFLNKPISARFVTMKLYKWKLNNHNHVG